MFEKRQIKLFLALTIFLIPIFSLNPNVFNVKDSQFLTNETVINDFSFSKQLNTEQTGFGLNKDSYKVLSSSITSNYAKIDLRVDSEKIVNSTMKPAQLPEYEDDIAYEMVNVDKNHNWMNKISMERPGEGVTVAIVDMGVNAHEELMYKPDGTLRSMYYIDINWWTEWVIDWWIFGHWEYHYEATNTYIDTVHEWTHYCDYPHDSTLKVGVYDGWPHGTGTVGTFLRMAPYADLIVVDLFDKQESNDFIYKWGLELLHSWHDPDIVSCSWSGPAQTGIQNAIDNLVSDGTTVVLGSSGNDYANSVNYPAAYSNVMAIGAVNTRDQTNEGERASFSNYGPEIDVVAPGYYVNVPSPDDDDGNGDLDDFDNVMGTSYSTPIVAGLAAEVYQLLSNVQGSDPPASTVRNYIKEHCDPGGQDTTEDDYTITASRQNDYYGHGITDSWEVLSYATIDDFQDANTNRWSSHSMTTASNPVFDTTYYGGSLRGRMYMQDSSGDKPVVYTWDGVGTQVLSTDSDYDKYFSYKTKRSNGYTLAYHDFYPVLADSNNFVRVRFYRYYMQVHTMVYGQLTLIYEENVNSHTGWWCYDDQEVEMKIFGVKVDSYTSYIGMEIARRADGSTHTSGILHLADYGDDYPYYWTFMQGPVALGFRAGWSSGNYGKAYWDNIRVSQVPSLGLLG